MFTNGRNFNEGAVVSGNTDETSIIRCNTHQAQRHTDYGQLCKNMNHLLMFTNCGSFNEGAVISGNTDETSIIRCNAHQVQWYTD